MAHARKPDLVFQRNGWVHSNRRRCQFSRLLAVEKCGSADSNCIDRVPTYSVRLLAAHSIRIFLLHFPSRASPCAIRLRTRYTVFWAIRQKLFCCHLESTRDLVNCDSCADGELSSSPLVMPETTFLFAWSKWFIIAVTDNLIRYTFCQ